MPPRCTCCTNALGTSVLHLGSFGAPCLPWPPAQVMLGFRSTFELPACEFAGELGDDREMYLLPSAAFLGRNLERRPLSREASFRLLSCLLSTSLELMLHSCLDKLSCARGPACRCATSGLLDVSRVPQPRGRW